jgi:hypothetical protein
MKHPRNRYSRSRLPDPFQARWESSGVKHGQEMLPRTEWVLEIDESMLRGPAQMKQGSGIDESRHSHSQVCSPQHPILLDWENLPYR